MKNRDREEILRLFRQVNAIDCPPTKSSIHLAQDGDTNILVMEELVPWIVAGISIANGGSHGIQVEDCTIRSIQHPLRIELIDPSAYDRNRCPEGLPEEDFINEELWGQLTIGPRKKRRGLVYARICDPLPQHARSPLEFEITIDFVNGESAKTPIFVELIVPREERKPRKKREPLFPNQEHNEEYPPLPKTLHPLYTRETE